MPNGTSHRMLKTLAALGFVVMIVRVEPDTEQDAIGIAQEAVIVGAVENPAAEIA